MRTWVKLYTEIIEDPDQGTLSLAQRGLWSMFLALAGRIDDRDENDCETGRLDTVARVAWRLHCQSSEVEDAIAAFADRGMVEVRDGVIYLPNYATRQQRAPSDRRAAVADRVKRHRNEHVTPLHPGVTSSESESESDTDTDADTEGDPSGRADARATLPFDEPLESVPEPEPEPAPRKRATMDSTRDPRTNHPAIQAFRAVTRRYPSKDVYDKVIEELGPEPDVGKLRLCFTEWRVKDYRATNLGWLFEWYHNGGPPPRNGNGHSASEPLGFAAIRRVKEKLEHGTA